MNTLELILEKQKEFQAKFGYEDGMDVKSISSLIHTHSAFAIEEIYEMLRELPYHKPWKDYSDLTPEQIDSNVLAAQKELLDVIIFVSNIAIFLGLDEKKIREMYLEKNNINIQRQEDPLLGYVKDKAE